jgi:hypothetical protein
MENMENGVDIIDLNVCEKKIRKIALNGICLD